MSFSTIDNLAQNTREFNKFLLDPDGEVCVRVCITDGLGDISVTSTPAGLDQGGIITTVTVSTTAAALPTTAAAGRNHISIYNKSTTDILYIGFANTVTADDGADGGWEIEPESKANFDLKNSVIVYGIYASGSHKVKVLEI